jgi:hypothetical protein
MKRRDHYGDLRIRSFLPGLDLNGKGLDLLMGFVWMIMNIRFPSKKLVS